MENVDFCYKKVLKQFLIKVFVPYCIEKFKLSEAIEKIIKN
jgi:hypothetical protein